MNKYRICTDTYAGYEVQARRWWWPFWSATGVHGRLTNTFSSLEDARNFAKGVRVVEELGKL